jgi:hypothetical protein
MLRTLLIGTLLAPLLVMAQAQDVESGIGYPTVAAALEALKAKNGVKISIQGGWTIVEDASDNSFWSFTPPGHPAHPTAVKRYAVQKDGATSIQMKALCQTEKAACDKLIAEFTALNERIAQNAGRNQQPKQNQWAPTEQQKSRATETLGRFLAATDGTRYEEAYTMLTPGMKSMMTLEQFVSLEEHFRKKSGGEPKRADTRVTWYKDPPRAAPGVYAAFDIRCSYRNINMCAEVVILHEQENGQFLVLRQERNVVDKENEQRLQDRQNKRQGS